MELRARFDEFNNIEWANRLEEAGCRVIYGPKNYKTHSKICLITKKDFGGVSYITQAGTGNYNEVTAKIYTDLSLITYNQAIGQDVAKFFTNLMLGNLEGEYSHLWTAPHALKAKFLQRLEGEVQRTHRGEKGQVIIKCNSLTDKDILLALIDASKQGVKITLIVRGICCLIPQVAGLTDNITVISIVGRFLEHSRIFCFGPEDQLDILISSADLMTRNTENRVEIACPIYDNEIKKQIYKMLDFMIQDNTKAWALGSDGNYRLRRPVNKPELNAQEVLLLYWDYDTSQEAKKYEGSLFLELIAFLRRKPRQSRA